MSLSTTKESSLSGEQFYQLQRKVLGLENVTRTVWNSAMDLHDERISAIHWPDIVVIVLYLLVVLVVASCASFKAKRNSSAGFFLAGRNTHWIPIGASTFVSNVGTPMFVGLAGSAAASGMAVTMFEWQAMLVLLALGWFILPVYMSSGCYTTPQYLSVRYGGKRIHIWQSVVQTALIVIIHVAGQIYSGTIFLQQIFNWNIYSSMIAILIATGIFTAIGGLKASLWTDTIQTLIILIGATTVTIYALIAIGGFEGLRKRFLESSANYTIRDVGMYGNRTCGLPPVDSFHIFRPADSAIYPWPGMVFGLSILAFGAWAMDQTVVQCSLSAKNLTHAKAGLTLTAYLKISSFFFFVVPGMISRVLYPQEIACADPIQCLEICGNKAGCYDIAYPLLVLRILPPGVRGLMMAALLSAMVSSLTSAFNSSSTIFTMDIWRLCRPKAKESERMVVGRLWIIFMVIVGVLWIPILHMVKGSQFWSYSQSVSSFLSPPAVMVYLFGIFWKRTTEQGAFCGLVAGLVVGITRMGLEWSRTAPLCGTSEPDTTFEVVRRVNYLHFAIILSGVTSIVIVVVSLLTLPTSENQLRRVTWWTRHAEILQEDLVNEGVLRNTEKPKYEHALVPECQTPDLEGQTHVLGGQTLVPEGQEPVPEGQTPVPDGQAPFSEVRTFSLKDFLLKWFCGVDKTGKMEEFSEGQVKGRSTITKLDIGEDPVWSNLTNANGFLCAAICIFLHGFFA